MARLKARKSTIFEVFFSFAFVPVRNPKIYVKNIKLYRELHKILKICQLTQSIMLKIFLTFNYFIHITFKNYFFHIRKKKKIF